MLPVMPENYPLLAKLLDASVLRQKAIAQNIANVNTPGYKRLKVEFEEQLSKVTGTGQNQAIVNLTPKIVVDHSGTTRQDGNNVDIDRELGQLTKNTLRYEAYVQILASELTLMRLAIVGR